MGTPRSTFKDVRVPVPNMLLGEGRGFRNCAGTAGSGSHSPLHARIGAAERALELMCDRAKNRVAFGKPIAEQTVTLERIAESRIGIEQARLLTLSAAYEDGHASVTKPHARRLQ